MGATGIAPAAGETIRICDDKGCSDRPRGSSTFDPAAEDSPELTRRVAALSAVAAKDPRAAFDLGMRYLRGDGVRQDGQARYRWRDHHRQHGYGWCRVAHQYS